MKYLLLSALSLSVLGAGCVDFPEQASDPALELAVDATITLEQNGFGLLPSKNNPYWEVVIDSHQPGQSLAATWRKFELKETAASVKAREAAEHAAIGDANAQVPEPMYETVASEGTFSTEALDSATGATLPTVWKANDNYDGVETNSVLWLSRAQYDELVSTRHTEIELNIFGTGINGVLDAVDNFGDLLENLGTGAIPDVQVKDLVEIEAEADWGSYTVKIEGNSQRVEVIEAKNRFAKYVILANPNNPLILEIKPEPLGFGSSFISSFGNFDELSGYHVTELKGFKSTAPTSEDQPAPQAQ